MRSALLGRHQVQNALAALAVRPRARASIARRAAAASPRRAAPAGRIEVDTRGGVTLLLDHYNANPDSARAALDLLASLAGRGARIAVLGDMLELGASAPAGTRAAGRRLTRAARSCGAR